MSQPEVSTAVRALVLDDGEYTVELVTGYPGRNAPVLLLRRCYEGVTTPDGQECIGRVDRGEHGLWTASVQGRFDERKGSDARQLGAFVERNNAIAALWQARRDAYCRHHQ